MEIVANERGKLTIVYDRDQTRPKSGAYLPDFIEMLSARYAFVRLPNPEERRNDLIFEEGKLSSPTSNINIFEFILYPDGITATTSHTDLSHAVLKDVMEVLTGQLGLRHPKTPPSFIYENSVVVEFDHRLSAAISIYDELKREFDGALSQAYGRDASSHLVGFGMGLDPDDPAKVSKKEFTVIRRVGYPFSGNRFYSTAPLPTAVHHSLLLSLERMLQAI